MSSALPVGVASLAGSRGLGGLAHTRKGHNPVGNLIFCLVGAAVLFGLAAATVWLAGLLDVQKLGIVAILFGLAGLFAVAFGFYMLAQGFHVLYVYDNGIVWTHNGRPHAATWAEVDGLVIAQVGEGHTPHGISLVTLDGRGVEVTTRYENDVDPVVDHLTAVLRRWGRPVQSSFEIAARAAQEAVAQPETGLEDRTLGRICAIGGLVGAVALAVVLAVAGLPGQYAAIIGPFLVGVALAVVGIRIDPRITRAGQVFIGISFVIIMFVVIHDVPYNGFVEAGVVLAVQGMVVAAWNALYRRLPMPRRLGPRRKLAAQMGWQYLDTAPVPVSGPQTVQRLIGVPSGATGTTGTAVVTGASNGWTFLVYDRLRRPPKMKDTVLSVWMVQLPMALPYVSSREVADGATDELTRAVATSGIANTVAGPSIPPWWIEGQYLYSTQIGLPPGEIGPRIDVLIRMAAALPWQALHRFAATTT